MTFLKDIVPAAQNNIDTQFILLVKGKFTRDGETKTCLALVADETAAVHFQLWGVESDAFQTGDIIHLSNGIFSYQRNNVVLRAGKRGKIEKTGEFTLPYVETPNMSEISWVPDPTNPKKYVQEKGRKYELVATITQYRKDPSKGHYTADSCYGNVQWLRFDYASVTALPTNKV